MKIGDPIKKTEYVMKELHDSAGKYTQPVLRRYPLLFSFLIFFSIAALLQGFEILTEQMDIFQEHPMYLILAGSIALFLTGMLYKSLEKNRD
jgi:hypothetical protein